MIGVTVLGATGSIGGSTLAVLSAHSARYRVIALTANTDVEGLYQCCLRHQPQYAVMVDADAAQQLQQRLQGYDITVYSGIEGLVQVACLPQTDFVMAAIVGAAGLLPTLAAARAGKRILLANKEALVMAGRLFMQTVAEHQAELLPIDSEHNAVFQCLPSRPLNGSSGLLPAGVKKIWLTASGGPFRRFQPQELAGVTPQQACAHPNWTMGPKISVDSATLMNKGLEVIEAHWLFNIPAADIGVVVHPQSIIHALVEYQDGSVLAHLGNPDMRIPITHALAWPQRMESGAAQLDLLQLAKLEFEPPDIRRFPCLGLAYQALQQGGTAPAILNAANEIAVQAFLANTLAFTAIPLVIERTLAAVVSQEATTLDIILDADQQARQFASQTIRTGSVV